MSAMPQETILLTYEKKFGKLKKRSSFILVSSCKGMNLAQFLA